MENTLSNEIILSIDCGTQSLRAMLFDKNGELLDKVQIHYEPYFSKNYGWAEQDPDVIWKSLCDACKTLKEKNLRLFDKIIGMGVTTQRDSMVCVDKEGNALRPIITWLDQRKAKVVYKPNLFLNTGFKIVGMDEAIAKIQVEGKSNWIKQNQPEIWEKTYKYLQISGFLNFKLTGEFKDSVASQIGHIPFNYKRQKWASDLSLSKLLFPVEKHKLVDLVKPGMPIGKITKEVSKETGIAENTPVIACGSDKGCETIGMGVVDEDMASLSFGTTATVQTTTKRYFEPIRFMPPYPAGIPGQYNPEVEIFRGYWMITWFKNEFAHKEALVAQKKDVPVEVILNEMLAKVPAGSMGLVVQPYWSPHLKNPFAKGAMIGFGDVHKKAHVYRAVIEGLSYALLDGLHQIEGAGKINVKEIAVSGGASQSNEICQITADVFNRPLVRGKTNETSGLGAAIIASVGLGIHSSFQVAIEDMVHYEKTFKPDAKNMRIYSLLYERVYKRMYESLEPLYKEISEITGYPKK